MIHAENFHTTTSLLMTIGTTRSMSVAAMAAILLIATVALAADGPKARPNIVVILADDLGYGDVQCYAPGKGKIATPRLDRLAGEGMRFTDAHTPSSVCTPTRYGLLTGRYAWRTRLASGVLGGYSPPLIEAGRTTVASLLKGHGYVTACVGKWHLGWNWPAWDRAKFDDAIQGQNDADKGEKKGPLWNVDWAKPIKNGPTSHGFDYYFGISASLDMPPYVYVENDRVVSPPTTTKKWLRAGPAAADFEAVDVVPRFTREAIGWMEKQAAAQKTSSKPFFLYLPLTSPHTPIVPAAEFQGKSGVSPYGDFVQQTDAAVGQVLDALEKMGVAKETLVIFTSDNGCSPAADVATLRRQGHEPSGPLRGLKSDLWEGGHRVPFLARWPGQIAAGSECRETICLTDLLAIAAAIVEAKLPDTAGEDSDNILPLLRGEKPASRRRDATVHHSIQGRFAIRQGEWKLLFAPGSGGWGAPTDPQAAKQKLPDVQLYNMAADLAESKNIAAENPEIVERLRSRLKEIVASGRSTPGEPQKNARAITLEK